MFFLKTGWGDKPYQKKAFQYFRMLLFLHEATSHHAASWMDRYNCCTRAAPERAEATLHRRMTYRSHCLPISSSSLGKLVLLSTTFRQKPQSSLQQRHSTSIVLGYPWRLVGSHTLPSPDPACSCTCVKATIWKMFVKQKRSHAWFWFMDDNGYIFVEVQQNISFNTRLCRQLNTFVWN